jgi:hypothetical protein
MISNQASANQSKRGGGQEPPNLERRTLIAGGLAALLAAACSSPTESTSQRLSSSGLLMAEQRDEGRNEGRDLPSDLFILLLKGLYQPVAVGQGPRDNLGLSKVHLSDGTYSKTKIYPIFGIPGSRNQDKAIGTFYVQFNGKFSAYDLPGGAIVMSFDTRPAGAPPGFNDFVPFPDGMGGTYLEGTFELTILEATGIYRAFQGGHNHMVDRLHHLANGSFDEFCFCNISQYQFP